MLTKVADKYKNLAEELEAIKWLGNAGSHSHKTISHDDVLDAYDLMEISLEEIFDNKKLKAKRIAKKINKHKGPKKGKSQWPF